MNPILQFPHLSPAQQEAILSGPAMAPPPGVVPNLAHPPNRNHMAIIVGVICIVVVSVLVSMRTYSRFVVMRRARIEDYLGVAAFGAYIGMIWAYFQQLHYGGYFVHQYNISFRNFQEAVYIAVLLPFIYSITMVFAKSAILFEWMHIFVPTGTRNVFFWMCSIMMTINILLYSSGVIAEGLGCIPLSKTWKPWLEGKCFDKKKLDVTTAYFNLMMDLLILLLPQKVIWKLQMSTSRKIGVSVIFSFGFLTIACAAGRVWSNTVLPYVAQNGDTNYGLSSLYLWGFAETTCVLIVFSVPALPKAFTDSWLGSRIAKSFRSWTSNSSSRGGSSKNSNPKIHAFHREMDENSQTGLTELDFVKPRDSYPTYNLGPGQENGGIVRHTKIETKQDTVPASPPGHVFTTQHPWAQED